MSGARLSFRLSKFGEGTTSATTNESGGKTVMGRENTAAWVTKAGIIHCDKQKKQGSSHPRPGAHQRSALLNAGVIGNFFSRTDHRNGTGCFSNNAGRNTAQITAQHRTSAGANNDMIDAVMARVVNELTRRIC